MDDVTAHWRPERYYAPGTTVTVAANIFGQRLGDGLYGLDNATATFTIGDAHISIADDRTKTVSVFDNGKLVRAMPTSMGKGGFSTIAGRTFSFWTPPGVYTVIDKAEIVTMDSSTYGLPVASSEGYKTKIPYATRISTDGIYLHQLNDTVWAQGNTNVSHGCLNLSGRTHPGSSTSRSRVTSSRSATPAGRGCRSGRTGTGRFRGPSGSRAAR